MTALFECSYGDERYFGFAPPTDRAGLRLYPGSGDELAAPILESGGDIDALTAGREPVDVPAGDRDKVRTRVPLFPDHVGDALVSGFMKTHNVKVDAATPDQPNWFFKGLGEVLKLPGEPLSVPGEAVAVCEEAEVVLVYVGDAEDGRPRYVGYTFGNDVTDIGRFKRHNGHLSYAKLCDSAISPALHLGPPPSLVTGETVIERGGALVWKGPFTTGTSALHYDLDTMMATLFAHESLHWPGRVHYVYMGADRSSFHGGHAMADGDRVTLDFRSHGIQLTNPLVRMPEPRPAA
ncbi:FAH family protein [Streptomyces johnsoniae]|uniref:FAH family protein n=1 Tax=Streptomyces johnsoniae TaxID=3075532 RepID=A0ABU2SCI0_9ACTN|nr:FAH family protein [Streptomyces sp. DSM 41886]MDT0445410.1 FAH family protein [Streptomyces sp. DSM 41886]